MLYAIYTGFGQPIVQGWILEREQKINGHINMTFLNSNFQTFKNESHVLTWVPIVQDPNQDFLKQKEQYFTSPSFNHSMFEMFKFPQIQISFFNFGDRTS